MSLGLEDPEKIAKLDKEDPKIKEIKLISERLVERAMKQLGKALRKPSTEPVNEVIRGTEDLWKLPCQVYHISCRGGRPRINWILETATQAWDKFKLWKKTGNEVYIPVDFDYKKKKHVRIIIDEALAGTF